MRIAALGIAGYIAAFVVASAMPASAQTPYYPWCSHYGGTDYGGAISCGFVSLAQCMATVSGIGGSCERNVLPPPPPLVRPARKRRPR